MSEHFDCEETKKHVHEFLQHELEEHDEAALLEHIANCDGCDKDVAFEDLFNSVIKRSCQEAPVEELAERVKNKLKQLQLGIGAEADA